MSAHIKPGIVNKTPPPLFYSTPEFFTCHLTTTIFCTVTSSSTCPILIIIRKPYKYMMFSEECLAEEIHTPQIISFQPTTPTIKSTWKGQKKNSVCEASWDCNGAHNHSFNTHGAKPSLLTPNISLLPSGSNTLHVNERSFFHFELWFFVKPFSSELSLVLYHLKLRLHRPTTLKKTPNTAIQTQNTHYSPQKAYKTTLIDPVPQPASGRALEFPISMPVCTTQIPSWHTPLQSRRTQDFKTWTDGSPWALFFSPTPVLWSKH